MSGSDGGAERPSSAAEAEFARYKARMAAAGPMMMPVMMPPGGVMPGAMPGWAVPPSLALFGAPGGAAGGSAGGVRTIGEGLGTTVRLGIELLNAVLASSAGALGGAAEMLPHGEGWRGEHGYGCGCHCCCATDCCALMGCGCCEPGISGCCR
ncbi:MAG: hypothetical protein M0002_14895 [Rhodospirillales bacterium]|nr:hypothetical protein [Rhodospirillales bacterium]